MINETDNCPFCNLDRDMISHNQNAFAIYDGFPVSDGHVLVISRRHTSNYFDLTVEEQQDCFTLLNEVKMLIDEKYHPDGFNVGININQAAGQTIGHVHVHLIPRYVGDVERPKGGVRGVIMEKKFY